MSFSNQVYSNDQTKYYPMRGNNIYTASDDFEIGLATTLSPTTSFIYFDVANPLNIYDNNEFIEITTSGNIIFKNEGIYSICTTLDLLTGGDFTEDPIECTTFIQDLTLLTSLAAAQERYLNSENDEPENKTNRLITLNFVGYFRHNHIIRIGISNLDTENTLIFRMFNSKLSITKIA